MEEIETEGYDDFRRVVDASRSLPNQWQWMQIRDDDGNEITRVDILGDDRGSYENDPGDYSVVASVHISVSDADIPDPSTIGGTALFTEESGGEPRSVEDRTPFVMDSSDEDALDEITVYHEVLIPEI